VGPTIWAEVSMHLLDMMCLKLFDLILFAPVSHMEVHFVWYAFINDTDLIQVLSFDNTSKEVMKELQKEVDT
jgi:hypothetical protein